LASPITKEMAPAAGIIRCAGCVTRWSHGSSTLRPGRRRPGWALPGYAPASGALVRRAPHCGHRRRLSATRNTTIRNARRTSLAHFRPRSTRRYRGPQRQIVFLDSRSSICNCNSTNATKTQLNRHPPHRITVARRALHAPHPFRSIPSLQQPKSYEIRHPRSVGRRHPQRTAAVRPSPRPAKPSEMTERTKEPPMLFERSGSISLSQRHLTLAPFRTADP
jgi:hypothetical protein